MDERDWYEFALERPLPALDDEPPKQRPGWVRVPGGFVPRLITVFSKTGAHFVAEIVP